MKARAARGLVHFRRLRLCDTSATASKSSRGTPLPIGIHKAQPVHHSSVAVVAELAQHRQEIPLLCKKTPNSTVANAPGAV